MITWAMQLPYFAQINENDQALLIQHTCVLIDCLID